ncbi:DUF5658 family protein [Cohnella nanjingensis]|nr:DUF5658 family protein [Cohnella nanjingensis]
MRTALSGIRKWQWLVWLSFFDAFATDTGLRLQVVQEANPLARALYETNVALFYGYKLLLPLILLALHRHVEGRSYIQKAGVIATILYGLIALYHVGWLLFVIAE